MRCAAFNSTNPRQNCTMDNVCTSITISSAEAAKSNAIRFRKQYRINILSETYRLEIKISMLLRVAVRSRVRPFVNYIPAPRDYLYFMQMECARDFINMLIRGERTIFIPLVASRWWMLYRNTCVKHVTSVIYYFVLSYFVRLTKAEAMIREIQIHLRSLTIISKRTK